MALRKKKPKRDRVRVYLHEQDLAALSFLGNFEDFQDCDIPAALKKCLMIVAVDINNKIKEAQRERDSIDSDNAGGESASTDEPESVQSDNAGGEDHQGTAEEVGAQG